MINRSVIAGMLIAMSIFILASAIVDLIGQPVFENIQYRELTNAFEVIEPAYFGFDMSDEEVLYRYEFDPEAGQVNEVIPFL